MGRLLGFPVLQAANTASQGAQLGGSRAVWGHVGGAWPTFLGAGHGGKQDCRPPADILAVVQCVPLDRRASITLATILADSTQKRSLSRHTFLSLTFDSRTLMFSASLSTGGCENPLIEQPRAVSALPAGISAATQMCLPCMRACAPRDAPVAVLRGQ